MNDRQRKATLGWLIAIGVMINLAIAGLIVRDKLAETPTTRWKAWSEGAEQRTLMWPGPDDWPADGVGPPRPLIPGQLDTAESQGQGGSKVEEKP